MLRLLVSMLVTVLGLVNKLPVIGTVNRGLAGPDRRHDRSAGPIPRAVRGVGLVVITRQLNEVYDTAMHSSLYYKAFNVFNPFLYKGHKEELWLYRCQSVWL